MPPSKANSFTWLTAAIALLCWAFFIWACPRGFDFTDDAAYLANIAYAGDYHFLLSQYGQIWHPLYALLGGDIAIFRLAGGLVLVASVAIFAFAIVRFIFPVWPNRNLSVPFFSALLATVLWRFPQWLPTPSYNSLTLSGLLLFYAALFGYTAADANSARDAIAGKIAAALVAGVSLAVIGLAKPPAALAAVGIGVAWVLWLRPKNAIALVGIAAFAALFGLACYALARYGGIATFLSGLKQAYRIQSLRGSETQFHGVGNSILQPFYPRYLFKALAVCAIVGCLSTVGYAAMRLFQPTQKSWRPRNMAVIVMAVAAGAAVAFLRAQNIHDPRENVLSYAWYFAMPAILLAILVLKCAAAPAPLAGQRKALAPAVFLVAGPFVYAFGSDVPIYLAGSGASVFWAAAALLLCCGMAPVSRDKLIIVVAFFCVVLTAGMLAGLAAVPGRIGAPLWQQTQDIEIGPAHAHLFVQPATAEFLLQARRISADLKPLTPIINASESGPGLPFALGATEPGLAWLRWEGPRPLAYPREAIRLNGSSIANAWVITSSSGTMSWLSPSALKRGGFDIAGRYQPAGMLKYRQFGWNLVIWKPVMP